MRRIGLTKVIVFISFLVFIILLGLLRVFLFVNINNQLKENLNDPTFYYVNQIELIREFTNNQLVALKWFFTTLFTLLYLGISCVAVNYYFNEKFLIKITVIVYVLIVLISFFVMAAGYFYSDISESAYQFSRYLMGIAQSPLVLMILIPLFKVSSLKRPLRS